MVETFPLTDEGRSDVNQKLVILLMRLDESGNVLESLKTASIRDFKDRDEAVTEAMARLEQARKDAWTALEDAPRTDRSS